METPKDFLIEWLNSYTGLNTQSIYNLAKEVDERYAKALQLLQTDVSKRCLADIEIYYKHPSGNVKGKLMYEEDTLMLKCDGCEITLPNIEDCNVY